MATNSSDAGNPPDPRPDGAQDALVESIYRIALEPQTYDSFMGQWDSYISARIEELNALRTAGDTSEATSNNPEIETHFRIAAQLLEQMGRPEPETARAQGNANPQMLVDTSGRIVWASTAATHLFGLSTSSGLDALALEEPQARALRDMAAGLRPALPDNAPDLPAPLLVNIRTVGPEVRVIYMVARVLPEQHGSDVLLISKIAPDWPAAMPRMLRDGFALSASEIEICELVAEGLTPAGIAQARASALATVRTQIKKIMAKTHCTSQAELVRLLHSVMRVADDGARVGTEPWSMADKVTSVLLPDRSMPVEHYGDPNGYPVVFFHGMLDGNTMPQAFQDGLRQHNLHLICPVRPFFGTATGAEGPVRTAPERFGQDVAQMIRDMGLKKPILWGHMAGILYAYGAANVLPAGSVRGILGVSAGVPIVSPAQFSQMSRRQRLVAYTARYTPQILPFVLRAGIRQMDNKGEWAFMQSLYENAPHDAPLVKDPETRDLIVAGYKFTVRQGHRAFEIDSHNVVHDWSALVDGSNVPVRLLHGETDPVVSAESVREFARRRGNRVSLEVLQDTGQLIVYKHPTRVIEELCLIRDKGVLLDFAPI